MQYQRSLNKRKMIKRVILLVLLAFLTGGLIGFGAGWAIADNANKIEVSTY